MRKTIPKEHSNSSREKTALKTTKYLRNKTILNLYIYIKAGLLELLCAKNRSKKDQILDLKIH